MLTCTRILEFDAGHRLVNHEGKCRHVHGHRYRVEATFEAASLDAVGRVVDFSVIKKKLGNWLDNNWDHTMLLHEQDKELGAGIEKATGQKVFYLPVNPTAEHMADYLFKKVCPELFGGGALRCVRLRLYETPNCYAEAG